MNNKQEGIKKLNWNKTLFDYRIPLYEQDYEKWDKDLEMEGQSLLEKDLPRTRSSQPKIHRQSVQKCLRRIATFFCKNNNFHYQQGLLQVIVPFALLHSKKCKTSKCYAYFNLFMKKHVPKVLMQRTVNNKQELPHTILAINLTTCLLNFHYPHVYELLKEMDIQLSLIVTQELMTIFAKNLPLQYVYFIFDKLICKNDPNFIFFICVSLIGDNEQKILQTSESSTFYTFIQNLKQISSLQDLQRWLRLAQILEKLTPTSFLKVANNLGFSHKSILSIEDVQNMLHSQQIFIGDLLPIYLSQIDLNLQKFILVTYDTTVPKKYKSLELKNETKYNKKKYNEKILVIVLNKGSEVSKLIEFAKQFQNTKLTLLRQSGTVFNKDNACSLF